MGSASMIVLLQVGVLSCRLGRRRASQRGWPPWPRLPPLGLSPSLARFHDAWERAGCRVPSLAHRERP